MTIEEDTTAPWYVRFIAQVGVPSAIALGLTVYLTMLLSGTLEHLQSATGEQTKAIAQIVNSQEVIVANQTRIIQIIADHEGSQARMTTILLAICANTADTDAERRECFRFVGPVSR